MAKKRKRFTVRMAHYHAPFDMFRYDQCWPATEWEGAKIEQMTHDGKSVDVTFETDNPHAPTIGRWESFACKVLPYDPNRDGGPY